MKGGKKGTISYLEFFGGVKNPLFPIDFSKARQKIFSINSLIKNCTVKSELAF